MFSSGAGLFIPLLNVHTHHEKPQGQQELHHAGNQDVREQVDREQRGKEVRETIGQVAHTRDRQPHAQNSGQEGRPENELAD